MKFSVLINNYNYGRFLKEAVESAYGQTYSALEILVVDDGSVDESLGVLEELKATIPTLRVISKENGGQLSAFRAGVRAAKGDYCCFLDADDKWDANHISEAFAVFENNPRLGLYCSKVRANEGSGFEHSQQLWPSGELGPVAGLVAATGYRFGGVTSSMILRREVARCVVDLDSSFDAAWRVRADDCLVIGASIYGALLYFNTACTVIYRVHGGNFFAQKKYDAYEMYMYHSFKERLVTFYMWRFGVRADRLSRLLVTEYRSFSSNRKDDRVVALFEKALLRTSGKARWRAKIRFAIMCRLVKKVVRGGMGVKCL